VQPARSATSRALSGARAAENDRLLSGAVAAARGAADVIRVRAPGAATLVWEEKSPSDFVSAVDRAAEQRIGELLDALVPEARLVGEEGTPDISALANGVVFVADPLDGTTNFLHGFPAYAVSIAALVDGELRAAAILDVTRDELFTATAGGGARCDDRPIRVSSLQQPSRALVGTGFPFKHRALIELYVRQLPGILAATAGIRRAGSAALDLASVASGRFDCFWELMLAPWDMAAGLLIVREAGGVVTDLQGEPATIAHGGLVAGNPDMHRWLLAQITAPSPSNRQLP
jgi:myo-inositol-1(or 4)-monophosphatase